MILIWLEDGLSICMVIDFEIQTILFLYRSNVFIHVKLLCSLHYSRLFLVKQTYVIQFEMIHHTEDYFFTTPKKMCQ